MGIHLLCVSSNYGCSYSYWNEIRSKSIKAVFDYLENKFNNDGKKDNENYDDLIYSIYMNDIIELKNICENTENSSLLNIFVDNCKSLQYINALRFFELNGIISLCNQFDIDGFYSPGNSLDICLLYDKIEPFIKKYKIYDSIYEKNNENCIYNLFENSYLTMNKIIIK